MVITVYAKSFDMLVDICQTDTNLFADLTEWKFSIQKNTSRHQFAKTLVLMNSASKMKMKSLFQMFLSISLFSVKNSVKSRSRSTAILGNAVTSQHGALLSDDIKALKTNR